MTFAAIAAWLWDNRRIVAEAAGITAAAGIIWWFGFHIPAERDQLQAQNQTLKEQVQAGQAAVTLKEDIQRGKEIIDTATQQRISSLRARPKPAPRGVLVPAGRLSDLPALRPAHVTR